MKRDRENPIELVARGVLPTLAVLLIVLPATVPLAQEPSRERGTRPASGDALLTTVTYTATRLVTREDDPVLGALVTYGIVARHEGSKAAHRKPIFVTAAMPPGGELVVTDIGAPRSGPVLFSQRSGSGGLIYSYDGLESSADDLTFSNDGGATFEFTPAAGSNGTSPDVTHIRVNPKRAADSRGAFSFKLEFRVWIRGSEH